MVDAARTLLPELRERIRRIERPAATAHGVLPFGVAAIDLTLPGGGLARGALHEILGAGGDEEDGALAAAFVAGIIGRLTIQPTSPSQSLTRLGPSLSPLKGGEGLKISFPLPPRAGGRRPTGDGVVLWCLPRLDLYGPGLAAHGLDPGQVVLVRAPRDAEILWAMEEGLRAPAIVAVVGEVGSLPAVASRRLQLAAERSGITAFLLRRWRDGGQAARERALPNAAVTRWRIAALPSQPPRGEPGGGSPRWRVELLRCRGGEPACWEMEVPDATDHVSLAAALADRPAAPRSAQKFRRAG
ncbi:MAG TPA: damage-inducible protein [Stellaceae bacterium]|nr:damage-inducible protein [Stellaceae bacterium]